MGIKDPTIKSARASLDAGEYSARDLTEYYFNRIKEKDEAIHSYLTVLEKEALSQADRADKLIREKKADYLTGIPLGIKDALLVKGARATGASKILDNYTATYDATVVHKLREQGAVFLGKTNLDEFAMGSSTENSAYGDTHNPWNLDRVPGGSSGGSAAAVAADLCIAALGSDTASSIRQPASFCGVVGLKPTYGRVSRYGLMAMTSSLDQIGPITKTVQDTAYLFNAMAGPDPHDSTTADRKPVDLKALEKGIKGLRIGIPKEFFVDGIEPGTRSAVEAAIKKMESQGATIEEVSLPHAKYSLAAYYLTATSEISTNLARYDGIRYGQSTVRDAATLEQVYKTSRAQGLGDEAKRRIILGTFSLSAGYYDDYYVQAQKVRALIKKEFADVFEKVDCLASPVAPTVAFPLGAKASNPLQMYLSDVLTVPANIGDICGISVPCGVDQELPVGLQLMTAAFDEQTLFRAAYAYEQSTDWHTRRPVLD